LTVGAFRHSEFVEVVHDDLLESFAQGPCDVPWSFTLAADETDDDSTTLVLGGYTTKGQATQVANRVRALAVGARLITVSEGEAGTWEELVAQYRFEEGLR
jgi:hypothetical protein